MANPNMAETEARNLINENDLNENGALEFDEFIKIVERNVEKMNSQQELRKSFDSLDSNNDGFLSSSDLRKLMKSDDEVDEVIRQQDIDGDYRISFEEFSFNSHPR